MLSKISQEIVFWFIAIGNFVVPKRRQILLHAFPDVEDQGVAILRWLRDNPKERLPIIYLVSGDEAEVIRTLRLVVGDYVDQIRVIRKTRLVAVWQYWRSYYVLFTHGLYGFLPVPPWQCVVNLWHGMPIKGIWKAISGSKVPHCRWLLSTSPKFSEVLASVSGFPIEKIIPIGLPRNDLLLSKTTNALKLEHELRMGADHLIVNLPTYRQSKGKFITLDGSETGSALCMSDDELAHLAETLASNRIRMLVKPHPMSVHYGKTFEVNDYLWVISDNWLHVRGLVLYDLLALADCLVTDTSSVYVDFLCTGKPVICYFPDVLEYNRKRQFLLSPIQDWFAENIVNSPKRLSKALVKTLIENKYNYVKLRRISNRINPIGKGFVNPKVFNFIN